MPFRTSVLWALAFNLTVSITVHDFFENHVFDTTGDYYPGSLVTNIVREMVHA